MRGLDGNNAVDVADDNPRAEVRVRRGTRNVFVLKPCYKKLRKEEAIFEYAEVQEILEKKGMLILI